MSSSGKLKIPLQEISSATNGFAKENIIGEGGYGQVYRGQSKQYGLLAIKRLIIGPHPQGDHEYGMEIDLLSKYKHENLVSLIGFCGEGQERILAYKYEANGSLDKVLHRKDISWMLRLQICLGAALGLRYLHNETGTEHGVVIHRDIKSSNILLDENWNAKILDFGLSKITLTTSVNSVIFTVPCGTQGYFDPQILYGGITQKSDVYSFGVLLYEVLFGKFITVPTGYDDRCDGRFTIEMARKHHKDKTLYMLIDPDLINEMNSDSLSAFSAIANQCLEIRTEDRPTMSSVVESLEKALGYQQASISRERFTLSSDKSEYLYDVYISFRMETEFVVDWLCDALKKGLSTYKDTIRTPRYVPFEPLNIPAIKQSRSFAIIFSKNFGLDFWILDEVKEIINCVRERGNVVIPVFWDVDPSDVSEQKGYFGKDMICREEWKNALAKLSNLPGLDQSDFKRFSNNPAIEVAAKIKRQLFEGRTKDL